MSGVSLLSRRRPSRRRGRPCFAFTLIEVLVVVAIIALLVAILLPSLGRARAMGRLAVCTSNTHQMGVAMSLFATEHKGRVPRGLSRHGGPDPTGPVNWVRMVARLFGDRNSYAANFNRVPVEKHEVFSCPERSQQNNARFLDYVINSTDSRGPLNSACRVDPIGGTWYEVEGVSKLDKWKLPAETIYVTDAIEESWNINDLNNSFGTMRRIRENIAAVRREEPPGSTGYDWFDVAGGRSFPTYRRFLTGSDTDPRKPRAALKMHMNRGSAAVYVDGHAAITNPPSERAGEWAVHEYYMRAFGVDRRIIPGSIALTTTATLGRCAGGDYGWRP